MFYLYQAVLFVSFVFLSAFSIAESPRATINQLSQSFDINPFVEYVEDSTRQLTYEDVLENAAGIGWQINKNIHFVGENPKSCYWFKMTFTLNDATALTRPILYILSHPSVIVKLELWMPQASGSKKFIVGSAQNYFNRDILVSQYAFRLPTSAGTYTIIGRTDTQDSGVPAILPFSIMSTELFKETCATWMTTVVAFYSVMLALLLYNAFLAIILREKLYGFYCLFILVAALITASMDGSAVKWLWPDHGLFGYRMLNIVGNVSAIVYLLFVYEALEELKSVPKLRKCFQFSYLVGGLVVLHNMTTNHFDVAAVLTQGYVTFILGVSFSSIVMGIYRGVKGAAFLLLAEMCTMVGGTVFMLLCQGIAPVNTYTFWSLHMGYSGEVIILSLALASRTRFAFEDKLVAEAENRAKSQFFASMSHEFRTPLTAILGYATNALQKNASEQDRIESLTIIEQSGNHMLQLVNDILDIAKIEAHKIDVEILEVDVQSILREVNDHCVILCNNKNLAFEIDYLHQIPKTIMSDPTRLKQILINLCANAIKFTHTGRVQIKVDFDEAQQLIHFAVQDTGIGMSPAQLEKLFSPYTQADKSTSRHFGGTGLGLYLSKQMAEKLGGNITVQSNYQEGSTFTLTVRGGNISANEWLTAFSTKDYTNSADDLFTAESALVSPIEISNEKNHERTHSLVALLADDNPVNLKLFTKLLRQSGFVVYTAEDGVEALGKAMNNTIDVIFMDMMMPIMDGLTTVKYLREKGFNKPIYALTADESSLAIQSCINAGCTGHLSKPINHARFSAAIDQLINSSLEGSSDSSSDSSSNNSSTKPQWI